MNNRADSTVSYVQREQLKAERDFAAKRITADEFNTRIHELEDKLYDALMCG